MPKSNFLDILRADYGTILITKVDVLGSQYEAFSPQYIDEVSARDWK